jgi:hypothetical protein
VLCPPGAHEYEYGGVPPAAVTVAVPLQTLQLEVDPVIGALKTTGCVMVTGWLLVQPLPSVVTSV